MADNDLSVVSADNNTRPTRSIDRRGVHHQTALVGEIPDVIPDLTGATFVYTVPSTGTPIALDPPNAGADSCRIRVWQVAGDGKRLFFRKDGTNPANDGSNAEGYVLHGEAMSVRTYNLANFKMMTEASGGSYTVFVEWLNSTP